MLTYSVIVWLKGRTFGRYVYSRGLSSGVAQRLKRSLLLDERFQGVFVVRFYS